MKRLVANLFLIVLASALLCVFAHAGDLPDAPNPQLPPHAKLVAPPEWQPTHKHLKFITNHPTRSTVLMLIGGAGAGLLVAHFTRLGTCPNIYDGKPYNGTPPCPK